MASSHPETLTEKLRKSRRTLERQIEEGRASCDAQQVLDRLAEIRKQDDMPDDALVQRGDA
jgi:tyrosyl-tRNA synthetase